MTWRAPSERIVPPTRPDVAWRRWNRSPQPGACAARRPKSSVEENPLAGRPDGRGRYRGTRVSTLAHTARAPGHAAPGSPLVRSGLKVGLELLVLPALVVSLHLAEPGDTLITRAFALESVAIAAAQLWISVGAVRKLEAPGIVRPLIPVVT